MRFQRELLNWLAPSFAPVRPRHSIPRCVRIGSQPMHATTNSHCAVVTTSHFPKQGSEGPKHGSDAEPLTTFGRSTLLCFLDTFAHPLALTATDPHRRRTSNYLRFHGPGFPVSRAELCRSDVNSGLFAAPIVGCQSHGLHFERSNIGGCTGAARPCRPHPFAVPPTSAQHAATRTGRSR